MGEAKNFNAGSREFMKNKQKNKKQKKRKNVGMHNKGSIGIKLHFTDKAIGHLLSQLTKYWYFIPLYEKKQLMPLGSSFVINMST